MLIKIILNIYPRMYSVCEKCIVRSDTLKTFQKRGHTILQGTTNIYRVKYISVKFNRYIFGLMSPIVIYLCVQEEVGESEDPCGPLYFELF